MVVLLPNSLGREKIIEREYLAIRYEIDSNVELFIRIDICKDS